MAEEVAKRLMYTMKGFEGKTEKFVGTGIHADLSIVATFPTGGTEYVLFCTVVTVVYCISITFR
jgi:hypothetical protein